MRGCVLLYHSAMCNATSFCCCCNVHSDEFCKRRRLLGDNGAFLAWHILRLFCVPAAATDSSPLRCATLDKTSECAAPDVVAHGSKMAWDRLAVAREFAEQVVISLAGDGAHPGATLDFDTAFALWQERMPRLDAWPEAVAGDVHMDEGDQEGAGTSAAAQAQQDATAEHAGRGLLRSALKGVALEQAGSKGAKYQVLPARSLSLDAKERFKQLFAARPLWRAADLEVYLRGVYADGCKNAAELLLKHTRAVREQPDAPALHCAR